MNGIEGYVSERESAEATGCALVVGMAFGFMLAMAWCAYLGLTA